MNRLDCSVVHIARFSLQARSALSIGTGGTDGVFDHPIVRDANGLPLIPGTSLAGVLRRPRPLRASGTRPRRKRFPSALRTWASQQPMPVFDREFLGTLAAWRAIPESA